MILADKVGHKVLKRGDVVKAPSGSSDWVGVDHSSDNKIILACISKYMTKEQSDLSEWNVVKN